METLIHHTHHIAAAWQRFIAALAMLGMGLAGESAELDDVFGKPAA